MEEDSGRVASPDRLSSPTEPASAGSLGPSGFDPARIAGVAAKLSSLEKQLLLGQCSGWGSWMWDAGKYMCSLGLGTRREGSIQFDTPMAAAVIAHLRDSDRNPKGEDGLPASCEA